MKALAIDTANITVSVVPVSPLSETMAMYGRFLEGEVGTICNDSLLDIIFEFKRYLQMKKLTWREIGLNEFFLAEKAAEEAERLMEEIGVAITTESKDLLVSTSNEFEAMRFYIKFASGFEEVSNISLADVDRKERDVATFLQGWANGC